MTWSRSWARVAFEHAAVGDHHRAADAEALPEAGDGQAERRGIGSVAGQDLPGHRPAPAVDGDAQHELRQVGATIAAVAVADQRTLDVAVEVDRSGVDEHQVELAREQVAVLEEELPLELVADRRQPRHGAVEVVQRQILKAGRLDRLRPSGALQVRARSAHPLQGQCEGHPLGVEAEPAPRGQTAEHLRQALPLPQPAKHQGRAPALGLPSDEALVLGRLDHPQAGAEAGQRLEQLVELTGGDEQIAAAKARHQLLAHPRAVPHRAHDLQVLVAPSVLYDCLDPHEHPSADASLPRRCQDQSLYDLYLPLHFAYQEGASTANSLKSADGAGREADSLSKISLNSIDNAVG